MEQIKVMEMLSAGIQADMSKCGYSGSTPYERGTATVLDYVSDKQRARFVFNDNRIHLLFGEKDISLDDDSNFTLDSTYLFVLNEYDEKDVKSLVNELNDYLTDMFIGKKKVAVKTKAPATVSKAAAKSGALSYDPITLATRLTAMFPETKEKIKLNIEENGEFLCEDFFCNVMNSYIMNVIRENNPQKMKKLFNILSEVYEDGTNEVQSLIAVTILGEIRNDPVIIQQIMPYLSDTMLEPVLTVSKKLSKSRASRMRLENPPKYKPKKQKKSGGLLSSLMGGGMQQQ